VIALWAVAQADPMAAPLGGGLLRAVVGTVLVLGTLVLLAYLLRRGVLTLPGQRAGRSLAVETALSLGDRRSVAVLNVEGRRLLLGLTPATLTVLAELGSRPFDEALDRAASADRGKTS